ncbi:MAG: tyrosine-type recombinase/integrase [Lachnospiraceae bacterium]
MENKIYLKDFPSYESATEIAKTRMGRNPSYDLMQLDKPKMREEAKAFIIYRSKTVSIETMNGNRRYFNAICRFLKEKGKKIQSFEEMELQTWERRLRGWMLENHLKLTEENHNVSGNASCSKSKIILYFEKLVKHSKPPDERDEIEKDVWNLEKLDIAFRKNLIINFKTLNFTKIYQPDIRSEVKKAIYMHLQTEAIASVSMELTAIRRLSRFLKERFPEMTSCSELSRNVFEDYLIYLKTEAKPNSHLHTDLNRLRELLETIGKIYRYPHLESMILTRDIPQTPKAEFKVYSDKEMKRLNAMIAKMEVQGARLMIIHQMLGTRISDTLTLQMDCLQEKNGETIIHIRQMKTHPFEKPVSEELASLIRAAMEYTREKYGETKYIFVNKNDTMRPVQYGTIQYIIQDMINKNDLRDDNGELFGFASHMYRHYYGVKLTEMHLDDWTIAKLLGHSSVRNVKYYRKMSNQILADETRAVRNKLSQMILDNLDGWGEEYEQIRQDDSLE